MQKKWIVLAITLSAVATSSIVIANHEDGHTSDGGGAVRQVKVVRHGFPHPLYSGGQWTTSSNHFVNVPGARTSITVPEDQKALIVVRFSPSLICQGTGTCQARIMINGEEAEPVKPTLMDSNNNWGVLYTERSRGPLGPGNYQVKAQVNTTYGTTGTTLYMRSYHLTVERVEA